jgi:hypothetical protein
VTVIGEAISVDFRVHSGFGSRDRIRRTGTLACGYSSRLLSSAADRFFAQDPRRGKQDSVSLLPFRSEEEPACRYSSRECMHELPQYPVNANERDREAQGSCSTASSHRVGQGAQPAGFCLFQPQPTRSLGRRLPELSRSNQDHGPRETGFSANHGVVSEMPSNTCGNSDVRSRARCAESTATTQCGGWA